MLCLLLGFLRASHVSISYSLSYEIFKVPYAFKTWPIAKRRTTLYSSTIINAFLEFS